MSGPYVSHVTYEQMPAALVTDARGSPDDAAAARASRTHKQHTRLSGHTQRAGETKEAILHFQRSLRLDPGNSGVWKTLGACLSAQGGSNATRAAGSKKQDNTPGPGHYGIAKPRHPRHFDRIEGGRHSISGGRTTQDTTDYLMHSRNQSARHFLL